MPNNVVNKISFSAIYAPFVLIKTFSGKHFDFEKLVKSPSHKYNGDLGREEDNDFPINWNSWNRMNWGTKWNAYCTKIGIEKGFTFFIQFETAWSVPYPVIVSFAKKFNFPFTHKYVCELGEFWGVEKWGKISRMGEKQKFVSRSKKDKNNPENKKELLLELQDYDIDQEYEE